MRVKNNDNLKPLILDWLKKAKDDELNARSILKHQDGAPSGVCFLAQQMAEKILKAYLLKMSGDYPKIHANDKLLELSLKFDKSFLKLKDEAIYLADFYISSRYPDAYYDFSWLEAAEAFKKAIKIKSFVLKKIKF